MAQKKNNDTNRRVQEIMQDVGKIPPQAIELEEAVLGAIMLEKDAMISVIDILKVDAFYKDTHRTIFEAAISLSMNHQPIDLLTVTEELKKVGKLDMVGGPYFLTQLTSKVASAAHVEYHARIVAQKYIQRELIRVSSDIQEMAFDTTQDVDELLDFAENELFEVAFSNIKKETQRIDVVIDRAIKRMEELSAKEAGLSGVPSGFTKLDRITSGWQPSDLVIIAARPSMGKTAFMLSMCRNMAVEHEKPVAIFSLEMSSLQLVNRLIVSETELASEKIRNGRLQKFEWEQLEIRMKSLMKAPIFIDDTPAISVIELRAKARRLKLEHKIELLVVDYLQLMSGPPDTQGNREQEVSSISRSLKAIAKELDIPIIALSQLNRSVELRSGDKRPQLSDLRESGAIEQDADIVIFIHRPEKYGLTEDSAGHSTIGMAEIILAKHRNGAVGDIQLRFKAEQAKFSDAEEDFGIPVYDDPDGQAVKYESRMNRSNSSSDFQDPF
jgi:replicative DNA helicase